jgi:acetyl-CoA carboxylase carboxyltransferase component
MSPDAAVELIKRDELLRGEDRARLVEEYCETAMSPYVVADSGDIDRVVSIDEIRPRIAAALEILALKDRAV